MTLTGLVHFLADALEEEIGKLSDEQRQLVEWRLEHMLIHELHYNPPPPRVEGAA